MLIKIYPRKRSTMLSKEGTDKRPSFFLNTGSRVLNLALSGDAWNGGWAGQRLVNIVGDTTTGKTLLGCEAVNQLYYNWHREEMRNVKCSYRDVEAAFDFALAEDFGMPLEWIDWGDENKPIESIQQYFQEMYRQLRAEDKYDCHLSILDSLDGISEDAEIERAEKLADGEKLKGTYGTQKAREVSAGLRLVSQRVKKKNMIIFVISQVRMKIGDVSRVKSFTRSGGKALDHSASQVVWLAEKGAITRTVAKRKYKIGKTVQVRVSKNRLYREGTIVEIDILDRHGIDDIGSIVNWLDSYGFLKKKKESFVFRNVTAGREGFIKKIENSPALYNHLVNYLQKCWDEVEDKLKPKRKKKYG
jgi:RecA/RadA recombinase